MTRWLFLPVIIFVAGSLHAQVDPAPTPQWRPVYHFTPLKNWTNDPNGLIYLDGVYNLYNQQNPYENKWGHMSWGHAVSTDLVHWKHLPVAMPEGIDNDGKDTTLRFSGSAVMDRNNSSGLCKNDSCLVAIYTADQPHLQKESQFIAYSNDGGMQFTNYSGNPVIDLHKKDFRDPSVSWNQQLKKWLMVVALPHENEVQLYTSANLITWSLLGEFGPAGLTGGIWECPFLVQLPVAGQPGKKKWVLVISFDTGHGTQMEYFVGEFDGTHFKNDNPPDTALLVDNGDCLYAGIPWNNLPGHRTTYIAWMIPPPGETTYPWKGQMSIPRDLSLRKTPAGFRLFQQPAAIIEDNLSQLTGRKTLLLKNILVNSTEMNILKGKMFHGNSYWLKAVLQVPHGSAGGFQIAAGKDQDTMAPGIEIGYDVAKGEVYIDKKHAKEGKNEDKNIRLKTNILKSSSEIKLEILVDNSSLEVFVNNGEKTLTTYIFPGGNADVLKAFSRGGNTLIKSLEIWDFSEMDKR